MQRTRVSKWVIERGGERGQEETKTSVVDLCLLGRARRVLETKPCGRDWTKSKEVRRWLGDDLKKVPSGR